MGSMAGNFTVGRKKYAGVEEQVRRILSELETLRAELLELVDEDVEAYGVVGKAYRLPRTSEEEKKHRRAEIQKALVVAMDVPLRIMRACQKVLALLAELVDVANPNLISDVGVSAIVTEAALRAAKLNVEINLAGLADAGTVRERTDEIESLACEAAGLCDEVTGKVERGIRGGR